MPNLPPMDEELAAMARVTSRYTDRGMTTQEVADELGLSKEMVRQITLTALVKARLLLQEQYRKEDLI